ncbi:MAG: GTP-binding protein [Lachnospiraceae bacterium]|nr:GTP-binding protein [Lachnospiraceae bacterium]
MTKIDIVSGFLGAGKTTLIKKMLKEAWSGEQVVLIENEFGEIGIDGGFLQEAGIEIKEMNSGCICCSLVGDFGTSLKEVMNQYHPERIVIEPSGVGKLSDVVKAVTDAELGDDVVINSAVAVVDGTKCKMYIKNFGEFFVNQVEHAGTIILSRTDKMSEEKLKTAVDMLKEHNGEAAIITTPWDDLDGMQIKETIEKSEDLAAQLMESLHEHHHDHDEHCCCGEHHHEHHEHHHDHDEHCCCGEHHHDHHEHHEHHHDHEEHCCCNEHHHEHHEHHHDHDEHCCCGGHHDHHGHHHADEVFTSFGMETPLKYTKAEIETILEKLEDEKEYGFVLRAKGMVPAQEGSWIFFDYVPGESSVREGQPQTTGKFCVIGSKLKEENLKRLFEK